MSCDIRSPRRPCRRGIILPTVQKILGHDSLQTTATYLNFIDVHIQTSSTEM